MNITKEELSRLSVAFSTIRRYNKSNEIQTKLSGLAYDCAEYLQILNGKFTYDWQTRSHDKYVVMLSVNEINTFIFIYKLYLDIFKPIYNYILIHDVMHRLPPDDFYIKFIPYNPELLQNMYEFLMRDTEQMPDTQVLKIARKIELNGNGKSLIIIQDI